VQEYARRRRDDSVLLARRGISPRHGFWTIPAGFMELGESADAGAVRELREETGLALPLGPEGSSRPPALLAVHSIPFIGQVMLWYAVQIQLNPGWAVAASAASSQGPSILRLLSLPHAAEGAAPRVASTATEPAIAGETLELGLFRFREVPWSALAFPSVHRTLRHYFELPPSPLAEAGAGLLSVPVDQHAFSKSDLTQG
jgi:ADP-ribose pyrophosphatase YjhB (NUDIX family)